MLPSTPVLSPDNAYPQSLTPQARTNRSRTECCAASNLKLASPIGIEPVLPASQVRGLCRRDIHNMLPPPQSVESPRLGCSPSDQNENVTPPHGAALSFAPTNHCRVRCRVRKPHPPRTGPFGPNHRGQKHPHPGGPKRPPPSTGTATLAGSAAVEAGKSVRGGWRTTLGSNPTCSIGSGRSWVKDQWQVSHSKLCRVSQALAFEGR